MKLVASAVQLARSVKVKIEKFSDDGTLIAFCTGHFIESDEMAKAAKKLGVEEMDIYELVENRLRKSRKPELVIIGGKHVPPPTFRTRQEVGSSTRAAVYDDFMEALNSTSDKHVIEWDNTYWCCVLDVDFHGISTPNPDDLLKVAELLSPAPVCYWLSKHGGLHCAYYANGLYEASELAAVAGYTVVRKFPEAKLEFLSRTRGTANKVYRRTNDTNINAIKTLLNISTSDDREQYLEEKGWVVGQRLEHIECPVNPSKRAERNTPPVVIRETFIHCFICESDGITNGSKKPGCFPYATLAGSKIQTQIAVCVNNFVHWSHAKHVLQQRIKDHDTAKAIYSALLKAAHGEDARIGHVFTACTLNGLIRYDGFWCDDTGKPVPLASSSPILKQLPHAMTVNKQGIVSSDLANCEWLSHTVDLSVRGYYAITPVRGIHITKYQDLPSNKVYITLDIPELKGEENASRRPRYTHSQDRMPLEEAWQELEKAFPGLDRTLIELLIVGRGCSEHRSGLPPMLFITGPTGSGKTSHIQIAAAICGDSYSGVKLNRDSDRFNNQLLMAKSKGGFVFFDEFFKFAKQANLTNVEAMENLLSFTRDQLCYMIYIGSVSLGELPLFLWADTTIPPDVLAHAQIGRRVFSYKLHRTLKWEESLRDYNIGEPCNLRLYGTPEMVEACNSILSQIIDDWFRSPVTDFAQVAEELQVKRIRDTTGIADERNATIKELFDAVCYAPEIEGIDDKKRFSKIGFKLARAEGICPVYRALELCQSESERNKDECRLVSETDLMTCLGLTMPATIEIRKHGTKYAIRFVSQDGTIVNEGLK